MVDFSSTNHGDVVVVHCCDECARKAGVTPKLPADSGVASWLCEVCGHHGIKADGLRNWRLAAASAIAT